MSKSDTAKAPAMKALASGLNTATGPDRIIDGVIARAFGICDPGGVVRASDGRFVAFTGNNPESYTASVDATLALIEVALPHTGVTFTRFSDGRAIVTIRDDNGKALGHAQGGFAPTTLCRVLERWGAEHPGEELVL